MIPCLSENSRVVSQYTDQVEEQHAYIKETVDTIFPSNIRILQVNFANNGKESVKYIWMFMKCVMAAGGSGQDQVEDPEAGEGHPGPEGGLQGALQDKVPHTSGVRWVWCHQETAHSVGKIRR